MNKEYLELEIEELKQILEEEPNNKLVKDKIKWKEQSLKLQQRIKSAIELIKEIREYFHDGIDEELIDILKGE